MPPSHIISRLIEPLLSRAARQVSSQFFGKGTVLPKAPPTEEFAGGGKVVLVTDQAAFKRSMVLLPVKQYF